MMSFVFKGLESLYRRRRGLRPLGPLLLIGRERYQGEPRCFADGTSLSANQSIGVLHFNNLRIAALSCVSRQHVGVRFARLFRESLKALAEHAHSDPALRDVTVFHGVTWLDRHGDKVGFVSEPVNSLWQRWWLASYFRLLARQFSPLQTHRPSQRPGHRQSHRLGACVPRRFWLTRAALIKHFGNAQS